MFGFGQKKKSDEDMSKVDLSSVDLSKSNDFQMTMPRYEYAIKVFEIDANDRPIVSFQRGMKANSDAELKALLGLSGIEKFQIVEKREINPNAVVSEPTSEPVKRQISVQPKYFSTGGLDFKIVGDEVFQKQWVQATEEECKKIRIINDKTNRIISLVGKHLEIQHWIKVESNDQD